MAQPTFQLDIVSPETVVFSDTVYAVQVPGAAGDFGVLPNHAPLMSVVRAGVITVDMGFDGKKEFYVTSGYAEVTGDSCTILSEHVQNLADISETEAEEALAHAKRVYDHATNDAERAKAQAVIEQAESLLMAVKG